MKNLLNPIRNLGALLLATAVLTTSALAGPNSQAFLQRNYTESKTVAPVQRPKATKVATSPKSATLVAFQPTVVTTGYGMATLWRH